ncbi:Ribosomal protein S18 acetylase RimI [Roseateles sp. YR242]|uniref:GNAT family N-acetyltransferase n=1 Tax=Roseateles sp. YR242 TaxID=1855305 RepID=UPI0008BAC743|nr:GNAT family N-acetyltransferase [Roseateles sp. YR242]SEK69774.1 Ribosomal protein S18 acetylase RimI [Roseateles sp. YR242]
MPQSPLVEKHLTIEPVDPNGVDAMQLMEELNQRLEKITGATGAAGFDPAALHAGRAVFLLARDEQGRPAGCGALRPLEGAGAAPVAELKRMYARAPGRGIGAAVLMALEQAAWGMGYRAIWLQTRRVNAQACAFYRRHGYHDIPLFGRHVGRTDSVCLGKRLQRQEETAWT